MPEQHPKFWYSRGYLPHYDPGSIVQFVTFRLADSLPQAVLERYRSRAEQKIISRIEYHRLIESYLDAGRGSRHLQNASVAAMIEENLLYFHGKRYVLIAWVIMPNHIHLLLRPLNEAPLAVIVHSMKSFTAKRANELLGLTGKFWSNDYFDRYMRDREHFEKTIAYIHNNPVKAGLCAHAADWPYGSARFSAGSAWRK
jgi:putative DNA methylase